LGKQWSRDVYQRSVAVATITATLLALAPSPARAHGSPVEAGRDSWTLRSQAGGGVVLSLSSSRSSVRTFPISLPHNAHDGPGSWFLFRLHTAVTVAKDSGTGSIYVEGAVGGHVAEQIQIASRGGGGAGCKRELAWSTLDLLQGARLGHTCARRVEVSSVNFVPYASISPRTKAMEVRVEEYGNAKLENALVYPDSGLLSSARGPAVLEFDRIAPRKGGVPDRPVTVPFVLKNTGARPARDVDVHLEEDGNLRPAGPTMLRVPIVRPGAHVKGSFSVRSQHSGVYELAIVASSTANHPGVEVRLPFESAGADASDSISLELLIGVSLVGAGVVLTFGFRDRRGESVH
jgi:hypothetical protein